MFTRLLGPKKLPSLKLERCTPCHSPCSLPSHLKLLSCLQPSHSSNSSFRAAICIFSRSKQVSCLPNIWQCCCTHETLWHAGCLPLSARPSHCVSLLPRMSNPVQAIIEAVCTCSSATLDQLHLHICKCRSADSVACCTATQPSPPPAPSLLTPHLQAHFATTHIDAQPSSRLM